MEKIKYLSSHSSEVNPIATIKSITESKQGIKYELEPIEPMTKEDLKKICDWVNGI
jgi:hypothetical protein